MSGLGFSDPNEQESYSKANAWVAKFAPLVMDEGFLTETELQHRLAVINELKIEAPLVQVGISNPTSDEGRELSNTVHSALGQLGSIEEDIRRQLSKVAPGNPDGRVDLDALQERLDVRAARQEVGLPTGQVIPAVLTERTSAGNIPAAIGAFIFGSGWTGFTAFHAYFMIGGLIKAIGFAALLLLLFYAIFFAVGFAMFAAAFASASTETLEINGLSMTITQKFGPFVRTRRATLTPKTRAEVAVPQTSQFTQNRRTFSESVVIQDEKGKQFSFGTSMPAGMRDELVSRINAYIGAQC